MGCPLLAPLRGLNTNVTCSYSLHVERFGDFHLHKLSVVVLSNLKSRKPWLLLLGPLCRRQVRPLKEGVPKEVWVH